jgi:hypothetical protein
MHARTHADAALLCECRRFWALLDISRAEGEADGRRPGQRAWCMHSRLPVLGTGCTGAARVPVAGRATQTAMRAPARFPWPRPLWARACARAGPPSAREQSSACRGKQVTQRPHAQGEWVGAPCGRVGWRGAPAPPNQCARERRAGRVGFAAFLGQTPAVAGGLGSAPTSKARAGTRAWAARAGRLAQGRVEWRTLRTDTPPSPRRPRLGLAGGWAGRSSPPSRGSMCGAEREGDETGWELGVGNSDRSSAKLLPRLLTDCSRPLVCTPYVFRHGTR